ncbi:hypothetical protein HYPP_02652 [Hyphomicrobium sp. ghe19]|nr:hypothetical protein HYPP_02652 [Hyphomicrobium sp. ghe19]
MSRIEINPLGFRKVLYASMAACLGFLLVIGGSSEHETPVYSDSDRAQLTALIGKLLGSQ